MTRRDDLLATAPALARRWLILAIGMTALLTGVAMTIASNLGPGSWQVLEVALAGVFDVDLGVVIVIESLVALSIAWAWLGQRPGPATVVLGVLGGPSIDILLEWLPAPTTTGSSLALLLAGSLLIAVGIALYVPAELGPSAQDSLFVGLYRRFSMRPGTAKFGTDFLIIAVGWVLGGPVGLGTVLVTFLVPPVVDVLMPVGHRLAGTSAGSGALPPVTATPI